ncbi:MAG TPA: hypothetical protein VNH46_03195 [Gemmatimonadales bacterium]|nr:hypothetical protein [Gemmatimonadales bacterium]
MVGSSGGRLMAAIALLTVAAAGCGKHDPSSSTGPSYGNGVTAVTGQDYGAGTTGAAVITSHRVFAATGDLTAALAEFRARLGEPSNKTAGEQPTGRREVNWDGVPSGLTNVDTFPADFFNRVVPRGQVYTTEGTGFRVSDNALADLNQTYGTDFDAFSPPKIFIPRGARALTVHFRVAGSSTPALVNGFGVVFSDVDREGSARLVFFDAKGHTLLAVNAPVRSDKAGFSFAGATFRAPIVAAVRIISGQAAITGSNLDVTDGGDADLVATDDFISGEPHAIR